MARILVVEDDLILKQTYDILLKREGHEVMRAVDGEEALAIAEKEEPDLILLDIMMPKMDGMEFLRRYDLKNKHPKVKVIVFSNVELPEQMEEAYRLGAANYMLKINTSPKKLSELVANTLADKPKEPSPA